jgi:type II secretory pathway component PulJ
MANGAMAGLTPRQREQVAAIVVDHGSVAVMRDQEILYNRARTKLLSKLERRSRGLSKRLAKAQTALERLRDYANDFPLLHGLGYWRAANHCLKIILALRSAPSRRENIPPAKQTQQAMPYDPTCPDPTAAATVKLYYFFRHECGLSVEESRRRTALIRNALWAKKQTDRVASPAVKRAVWEAQLPDHPRPDAPEWVFEEEFMDYFIERRTRPMNRSKWYMIATLYFRSSWTHREIAKCLPVGRTGPNQRTTGKGCACTRTVKRHIPKIVFRGAVAYERWLHFGAGTTNILDVRWDSLQRKLVVVS